jgi:hypothetical protein
MRHDRTSTWYVKASRSSCRWLCTHVMTCVASASVVSLFMGKMMMHCTVASTQVSLRGYMTDAHRRISHGVIAVAPQGADNNDSTATSGHEPWGKGRETHILATVWLSQPLQAGIRQCTCLAATSGCQGPGHRESSLPRGVPPSQIPCSPLPRPLPCLHYPDAHAHMTVSSNRIA